MKIREYFERIEAGETVKAIAESINKPPKALNRALERAGYEYNRTTRKWEYTGEGAEPLDQPFVFGRSGQRVGATTSNSTTESTTTRKPKSKSNSDSVRDTTSSSESMDIFDRLLNSEHKSEPKGYRGVYFSPEVNKVLDQIESGRRSEFIDECVKKVLKEKGLL